MKKTIIALAVGLFILSGSSAFAQTGQVTLPSGGITPDSPLYFLDRLGENIKQFFTFNSEAKAKLQIEFADERIAEIKMIVEKKGPQDKGIDTAKELLLGNVATAAALVNQEKTSGKDVTQLAKSIDNQFDERDKFLVKTFMDARAKLAEQHKQITENLLKDAQAAGDTTKVAELTQQLKDIENQDSVIQNKKEDIKTSLRTEKKKIEENMTQQDQQQDTKDQNEQDQIEQSKEKDRGDFETDEAKETKEPQEPQEAQEPQENEHETEKEDKQGDDEAHRSEGEGSQRNNPGESEESGEDE